MFGGQDSFAPLALLARCFTSYFFFFLNDTATTEIYTLSLHDALPISAPNRLVERTLRAPPPASMAAEQRSEEHTSELQSRRDLVCRLLLEKKKKKCIIRFFYTKKKKKIYL